MLGMLAATLGGPRVSIADLSPSAATTSPTNATVQYQLTNAGVTNTINQGGTTSQGNWVTPAGAAGANYEVRASIVSGSLTSGTTGSWLALSSTRTWALTQSSIGSSTCVLTIEIRNATSLAVLDSATITLTAEKSL